MEICLNNSSGGYPLANIDMLRVVLSCSKNGEAQPMLKRILSIVATKRQLNNEVTKYLLE